MNAYIVIAQEDAKMSNEELVNAFDRTCDGETDYREAKQILRRELLRRLDGRTGRS